MKTWIKRTIGIAGIAAAVGAASMLKVESKKSQANAPMQAASENEPSTGTKTKANLTVGRRWTFEQYLRQNIQDMRDAGFFHKDDNIEFRIIDHDDEAKDKSISSSPRSNVPVKSVAEFERLAQIQSDVLSADNSQMHIFDRDQVFANMLRIYNSLNPEKRVNCTVNDLVDLHSRAVKAHFDRAPLDESEKITTSVLTNILHKIHHLKETYSRFYNGIKNNNIKFTGTDGVNFEGHTVKAEEDPDVVGIVLHDYANKRSYVAITHHTWTQSEKQRKEWKANALEGMQLLTHDVHLALKER